MSINSRHPSYTRRIDDWTLMTDSYAGERVIKEAGQKYLPATSGQVADGMTTNATNTINGVTTTVLAPGTKSYNAYKMRALYHNFVNKAVVSAIGITHQKPPIIELPTQMEAMRENATIAGESLELLLRRINEAQFVTGRFGLLLDFPEEVPSGVDLVPYIATYDASCIINWDEGSRIDNQLNSLNLVVLDETSQERKANFTWEEETAYRVLILGDPLENEPKGEGIYRFGVFKDEQVFIESGLSTPLARGEVSNEIPFVFVNSKDIMAAPDKPPLLPLANLALAVYRGEADYRQALFMQGQDTLIIIGGMKQNEEEQRVGAGATIDVPQGGDAKYIGTNSSGLPEMRSALENDKEMAASLGSTILKTSNQRESGEALGIRIVAETATFNHIVLAGAAALEKILKIGARWLGANPDEVIVTPNMDFISDQLGGEELVKLITARTMGAPLSLESLHMLMQKKGLTEKDFLEEIDLIENEINLMGTEEGGNPPNEDENE